MTRVLSSAKAEPSSRLAACVVGGCALLRLCIASIPTLLPEEAYHWNFAKHLSLSYYDHPPMMAWLIWLSTGLLGDGVVAVRLPFLVLGAATQWVAYLTARRMFGPAAGLWACALWALMPVPLAFPCGAFPDGPLLFFTSLFLHACVRCLFEIRGCWLPAGAAAGLGLLSKYTGVLPTAGAALFFLLRPRRPTGSLLRLLGASLLAGALFLPVVLWNAQHEWASFKFQFLRRASDSDDPELARFLGHQLTVLSPLLLPLIVLGLTRSVRDAACGDPKHRLLLAVGIAVLAPFALAAARGKTHILWTLPGHYALTLAAAGGLATKPPARRLALGLVVAHVIVLFAGGAYVLMAPPQSFAHRKLFVWDQVAVQTRRQSTALAADGRRPFIIGYGREFTVESELAFKLGLPEDVFAKDLLGDDGMAYAIWSNPRELVGRDAVLVADSRKYLERALARLPLCFERHEVVNPPGPPSPADRHELEFHYVICRNYRGRPHVSDPRR